MQNFLPLLFLLFTLASPTNHEQVVEIYDEVEDISTAGNSTEITDDDAETSESVKRAINEHEHSVNEVQEEVKAELDKAVESLKESAREKGEEANGVISGVVKSLESCTPVDCNNRGTCIGSKKTFICACQLGYSGKSCEDTICDSARDCNGRGLCLGTTTQLTCLCNLGFTGRRCETPI